MIINRHCFNGHFPVKPGSVDLFPEFQSPILSIITVHVKTLQSPYPFDTIPSSTLPNHCSPFR